MPFTGLESAVVVAPNPSHPACFCAAGELLQPLLPQSVRGGFGNQGHRRVYPGNAGLDMPRGSPGAPSPA